MSRRSLKPLTNTRLPTEYVEVGKSVIGSDSRTVVKMENGPKSVHVYAEPIDDFMTSDQGKAHLHENLAEVFGPGGIDRSEPFYIDTSVDPIPDCTAVELHLTGTITREEIETHMRQRNYLLHPITEVFKAEGGDVHADVVGFEPSGYTTVRITDDTEFTFLDREELDRRREEEDDTGRPTGPESEEVDIDLTPEIPDNNFEDDVAGLEEVKSTAQTLLSLFDSGVREEIDRQYGEEFVSSGGSMLLYGPPGCGKTLVAEAIAYEAKFNTNIEEEFNGEVKFLPVKGSDILSRYPGEAERRVEAVFDRAHDIASDGFAVLFFDEIETLIPDRGDDDLQRHERSLTNAFLQEMDTDEIEDNLFVIGATNMPFTIDPAAARRFPVQQFIPQPDERVMADVWRKELADAEDGEGVEADIDYEQLGEASVGYTPAEITDRVLGTSLQRELIESVVNDGDPIRLDTDYLLSRLEDNEAKTVRQYIVSVSQEIDKLEGYPEMKDYVEDQAERLGIDLGRPGGGLPFSLTGAGAGDDDGESGPDSEREATGDDAPEAAGDGEGSVAGDGGGE